MISRKYLKACPPNTYQQKEFIMKSILAISIIAAYIFTAQDPQIVLSHQYKAYVIAQQFNPNGITKLKERILNDKKKLPRAAKQFLEKNIAWDVFAKATLHSQWDELGVKQKKEYTNALKKMMLKRYAKYFDPNKKFSVKFPSLTDYKMLRGEKFAKVTTIVSSVSNESEFEAEFIFIFKDKHWMLCDIYIDGVSKSRSYRTAMRKIYKKDGYAGLISKLKDRINKLKRAS
jgi:ABC-type transporter MlaC component